jgi:hypothetical protein
VTWSGLINLLSAYARSRSFFTGNNQFLTLNVTWPQWYNEYLNSSNIVAWTINDLRTWTNNYQTFLNQGGFNYIVDNLVPTSSMANAKTGNQFPAPATGILTYPSGTTRRRNLQANPNVFNGPNPLNVPIGENFTDFTWVPLPGVNSQVQPFEYQLRENGYSNVPNNFGQQSGQSTND